MNDLVASCLGEECSYKHLPERTPVVTNINTTSGGAGSVVTVTGTGFSNNASHVTVTIGNVECNVLSSSETTIEFVLGWSTLYIISIWASVKRGFIPMLP